MQTECARENCQPFIISPVNSDVRRKVCVDTRVPSPSLLSSISFTLISIA